MHFILISIGSNIDRELHTRNGVRALTQHFDNVELSSVYESEAVGFDGTPFYNLVASAKTNLSIEQVCSLLKSIETANGRVRGEKKFAPRTLDLDLLCYDQVVTQDPIVLPREEINYNAFVLQPLAELVPQHTHPLSGVTYAQLWKEYDKSKQQLWTIDFDWRFESQ